MAATIMWFILGLYRDEGQENGKYYNVVDYWGYIGKMEKKMETTIMWYIYWETTTL